MQVISSLLQLQSGYIKDEAALGAFRESQGRIKTMGLIHEMLYQSPNLSRIDFDDYLRNLTKLLSQSSVSRSAAVTVEVAAATVSLGIDSAVPLALIVNELVSNSLKHGFPGGRSGQVRVELLSAPELEQYCLIVQDNGVGPPAGFTSGSSPSLGLRIVQMLVEQLGAKLDIDVRAGMESRISFSEPR